MILILQEQRQGPRRQGDYSLPFTPPPPSRHSFTKQKKQQQKKQYIEK